MNKPVAICIQVYNEEKHISKTIQSILDQTFVNFDLIFSDNHSTDSTASIIHNYISKDRRIIYWKTDKFYKSIEHGSYFNNRIRQTNYETIIFLGGHDIVSNNYVEELYTTYKSNPNVAVVAGRGFEIDANDTILKEWPSLPQFRGSGTVFKPLLFLLSLTHNMAAFGLYSKKIIDTVHVRYDCVGVDHLWLAEISLHGDILSAPNAVVFSRRTEGADNWGVYFKKHISESLEREKIIADFEKQLEWVYKINEIAFAGFPEPIKHINLACALGSYFTRYGYSPLHALDGALNAWIISKLGQTIASGLNEIGSVAATFFETKKGVPQPTAHQPAPPPPPTKSKLKIAGEHDPGKDLTKIQEGSAFEDALRTLVTTIRPASIIETGTYLGTGTTRIIASALRDTGLSETRFFTIECNPVHHHHAVNNLSQAGLTPFVMPLHGLSVPRTLLPDRNTIMNDTVLNVEGDDIFVDHQEVNRVDLYHGETDFPGIPEDLLGECLAKLNYRPSLVLLDSAGHMGNIEFNYLIEKLRGECFVVLDDIGHIKHHKSFLQIQSDPRFNLLTSSDEKFGFCVARFTPTTIAPAMEPHRILFTRTDSIGDSILAMSMLPHIKARFPQTSVTVLCQKHIAELYETCPHCDNVITFDRRQAILDEPYRLELQDRLQREGFDLCLNSVYSRELVNDFTVLASGAQARIGHEGDLSNMNPQDRESNNRGYSQLVHSEGSYKLELERHRDFLKGIGIEASTLEPRLWLTDDDYECADRTLAEAEFDPGRTVVLFAGVQVWIRRYERYGEILRDFCRDHGYSVIALGSQSDFDLNQLNLDALVTRNLNLSGKCTLRQSAAIISRCRLAVGAETGLAHMACAVGTPNVILLGGGHFGRFMPYSPLTSIVCLPLDCYGCNWQCRYARPHCITDIDPVVFRRALDDSLTPGSGKPRMFTECYDSYRRGPEMPEWGMFNKLVPLSQVTVVPVDNRA